MSASTWLALQLADSAFPAGGLAHAGGLEAAMAFKQAKGRAGIAAWVGRSIDAAGELALPLVAAGWDAPTDWADLDQLADALITGQVANRASRSQGQSFLAAAAGAFGDERIITMRRSALAERRPAHHAPAFGVCARILGLAKMDAVRLHLHGLMRSLITAGVRLNAIGPLDGQALHHDLADRAESAVQRGLSLPLEDAAAIDPLLDIVQSCQDRLYSRLFTS
jgi:urease accessory protein